MQSKDGTRRLVDENVRYCLWKEPEIGPRLRAEWPRALAERTGLSLTRAEAILDGDPPDDAEIEAVSRAFGRSQEELRYTDLAASEDVVAENVKYLLDTLQHGGKAQLAKALDVKPTTIFRWTQGTRPRRDQLVGLVRALRLPGAINLEKDPVFLTPRPLTLKERHDHLHLLIEQLGPDDLQVLMPALERILRQR